MEAVSVSLSYHPDELGWIKSAKSYAKGWKAADVGDLDEIALERISRAITNYVWSPSVYRNGHRRSDNFIKARILGLDFDGTLSLELARKAFSPYAHLIGTTRNHQVEKNGKASDRFRVLLFAERDIESASDLKATLENLVWEYDADPACADAARLFFPCKEIVTANTGSLIEPRQCLYEEARNEAFDKHYRERGELPRWCRNALRYGAPIGEKQDKIFALAIEALILGWDQQNIFDAVWNSPIPLNRSEKCRCEVWKQIIGAKDYILRKGLLQHGKAQSTVVHHNPE